MDAESWRTTVRALLRADVHGFDIQKRNDKDESCIPHQPGLCDLISDIKSRTDAGFISHLLETSQRSLNQLALI